MWAPAGRARALNNLLNRANRCPQEPGSSLGRAPRASSRGAAALAARSQKARSFARFFGSGAAGSRTDASSTRSMASSTRSWRPSSAPTAAGLRSAWPCGTRCGFGSSARPQARPARPGHAGVHSQLAPRPLPVLDHAVESPHRASASVAQLGARPRSSFLHPQGAA